MNWENKQERAAFLEAFYALTEIHNKQVSASLPKFYSSVLGKFETQVVVAALHRAALELKFFPKPCELLEFITGSKEDMMVEAEEKAQLVLEAASSHGVYASVQFSDPVVNAVIRQHFGGWNNICAYPVEHHKWFVKDFCERYVEYKKRGVESNEPLRGIGGSRNIIPIGLPGEAFAIESKGNGQKQLKSLVGGLIAAKKAAA
ncbi:DUF6475 domain-containing protein [Maridesulfovibrio ferrireducens]|uniref:DUF6475 domain-containing protein n=1 Tax=Maridesulfovibrio ferrireducens TaxID=246191 RepID=UPI001A2B3775|nr:DUF6475 domain-containing protein [Maridesulfovibrio ferrireducens]MBI9113288.1 hypothetical protein [Maridesulfovibrio ferrireducens]